MKRLIDISYNICLTFLLSGIALHVYGQQRIDGSVTAMPRTATGTIIVFSEPAGAEILINGISLGVTPLKIVNMDAGVYPLVLSHKGYRPFDTSVTVFGSTTQRFSRTLTTIVPPAVEQPPVGRLCTLTVTTVPPGATLFVNSQPSGATPYRNDKLAPGTYRLRLELQGYDPLEGMSTLSPGESHLIEKNLFKTINKYGILSVKTTPSGASLFLNDQPSGNTPYRNEKLTPGNYGIRIELPGYAGLSERIIATGDTTISRQFTLAHSTAWFDSVKSYKLIKYRHGRMIRRVWFGCLASAAAGTGYFFETRVATAVKDQKKIQAEYRAATGNFSAYKTRFDDAKDQAQTNATVRNILYGVAGAFGIGFVISIPF